MSRKLLAFLLSELNTVRLICAKCSAAAELNVANLGGRSIHCPGCRAEFPEMQISSLGRSITALKEHAKTVEVEFVLPDNG